MKFPFLTLFFLLIARVTYAHLGTLTGTVIDGTTGLPLRSVTVQVVGLGKSTLTDELGRYRFHGLVASPYKVEFSHVGYASLVQETTVFDDQTTHIQARLTTAPVTLNAVTVSALKAHDQQLISSLDIRLRPITNSQEILRIVPGLFIGQHAGGGKAEQIFLRGFDIDHGTDIRLTVDDMPVNMVSHAHGQGYADLHFVIPELVEAVDFKKGSYSTDKGNFTTAGWANFRTRTTLDKSFVKLEGGQYGTFRAVAGLDLLGQTGRANNQSAYLASEYSYSDSYFEHPQNFKRFNIQGKYHGHLSLNTHLTLTGSTFWSKWNHSGQIPDRAVESGLIGWFGSVDPTEGGQTSRTNINAQLVTVTPRNHTVKNQFFYSNYNFELYSNFTFFLNDSLNGDQIRQKEHRNLFGYNGSYSTQASIGRSQWTTTLGAQYRQDITRETELSHTRNRVETLDRMQYGNINEINAALYADELVQLTDRFSLNVGLRYDIFRSQYEDLLALPVTVRHATQGIFSPKLNLYYTANPALQLYLNTGRGFHSNDVRVVIPQNGRQILPPAYGSDLGVIFKPFPKLLINAAAWYLWLQQEFVYVGDEGVVEPSGKTRRYGLDLSVRYQLTHHLYADLDLNTTRPRAIGAEAGQAYLPLAPTLTSVGGLSLQNAGPWSGSIRYRYLANRPANEDNSIVAKGYFVNDLQVNYTRRNYMLGLSVQNLFNVRWKETQFATESRLRGEAEPVEEIHFTPGTPFFARLSLTYVW
ncbi:outer membrane receptor protein involved in Fe transport [Larkinella arboricola]|uniref:Outer membrane receptor protein involved in Fe transport n=1 Tax=Larkinella arboricola TaxID=643671 RepID=A0A327XB78_LARAB|nr:TonB-dependent receptor [Larkinella arboricola]RAK02882.1 outer membrane receptor protein involved in Fe transport [Larkinella arboricola]